MKNFKTLLTTIVVLSCFGTANAYDLEVEGIYYNIDKETGNSLKVAGANSIFFDDEVIIPSEVLFEGERYIVTKIGARAFWGYDFSSIILPSTIIHIESEAFKACSNLKSIIIPENVKFIDKYAFHCCSELREVFFKGSVYPELRYTGFGENPPFVENHFSLKLYVINKEKALNTYDWSRFYSDIVVEYINFDQNVFDYNGQIPTVAYTNNLANKYELTMDVSNLSKDAGTHETILKGVYSNGLEIDIPYTYTINRAPLTIKVNDAEKIYGDENPTFTYSLNGFVNNEDENALSSAVVFSTKANKKSGAGTYSVSASSTAKNYEIGCTEGTLTIKKAPLTIKVNSKSRVYGDSNPQFDFTYIGLKNSDTTPIFTSQFTTSTNATKYSNVGEYQVSVSGGIATNYSFTEYQPGILSITQAPLNISVQSTAREYGEKNPDFKFTYSGFKNGDTSDCLNVQPTTITSATPTSSVGEYEVIPNGAESNNYAISYTGGTLTINKAPLIVQAENKERIYGDENPQFTFTYDGFKNEDSHEVFTNRPLAKTEAVITSSVGTYDIVPSGADAQNYEITYNNGTLSITKAPLSVAAVSNTKEYGETNPTIALTYSGFKNSDNEECISEKPIVDIDADKFSDVGEYVITVSKGNSQNYKFTEYHQGVLTIEKAPLNVIAENKERLYFESNPEFTYYCEGFKNDDTKNVITTEPTFECTAKQTSNVGEYEISLYGAETKNYTLKYIGASLNIIKRIIDAEVSNYTRFYNEENPKFEISYRGFVNNESERVFNIKPTIECVADETSNVGTYQIVASGAEATNYDFNYINGVLNIEKATQEIIWEQDLSKITIGEQVELTASATSGLDIEYELEENNIVSIYEVAGKIYLDCFNAGEITIVAIQNGNNNYYPAIRKRTKLVITDSSDIKGITINEGDTDAHIYNIRGERMNCCRKDLQKGIYIQNGQKFIVK